MRSKATKQIADLNLWIFLSNLFHESKGTKQIPPKCGFVHVLGQFADQKKTKKETTDNSICN